MLKSFLPNGVKVNISIDDFRLKSKLTTSKTKKFTEKSFYYTILDFTQSKSGTLGNIERFVQLISRSYKSNKPNNPNRNDIIHLKCDCNNGSIINGITDPILDSFVVYKTPGYKVFKQLREKLLKM